MRSRMFRVTSTGETFLLRMSSLNSVRLRNARSFVCELFCIGLSERRNRIHRRSGAAPDRQRRGRQQELPSFADSGSGAQSFKIAVVNQVDSQRNESEVMNRADNIRWRNILWVIGSQYGNILLLQNVAIGFIGDPVPPRIGSGAAVNKNSHRLRTAAAALRASRSQLSIRWIPSETRAKS